MLARLKQSGNRFFQMLFLVLLFAGMLWLGKTIYSAAQLPIQRVKIEGAYSHTKESEITQAVLPYVQVGFFLLDATGLKQRLQQLPWIKNASVSRRWPDTIRIRLTEQQAIAYWNTEQLLNSKGDIFHAASKITVAELPDLSGPDGYAPMVLKQYQQMNSLLHNVGLQITKCNLSDRLAWTLALNNGMKLKLGRTEPMQRLNRFVRAYNPIFGSRGSAAKLVDLRYPNGMAVRWNNKEHA